jgi:alginate O-acetyltransferase complex protein AlgI
MIVMALGGLWHGAALSYLLWGSMHGLLLAIERPLLPRLQSIKSAVLREGRKVFVFFCVSMLWIFFKLPDFDHALGFLTGMFVPSPNPNPTKPFYDLALLYVLPVLLQHLGVGTLVQRRWSAWEPWLYGLMAALCYLEAGPETAFIYFQF